MQAPCRPWWAVRLRDGSACDVVARRDAAPAGVAEAADEAGRVAAGAFGQALAAAAVFVPGASRAAHAATGRYRRRADPGVRIAGRAGGAAGPGRRRARPSEARRNAETGARARAAKAVTVARSDGAPREAFAGPSSVETRTPRGAAVCRVVARHRADPTGVRGLAMAARAAVQVGRAACEKACGRRDGVARRCVGGRRLPRAGDHSSEDHARGYAVNRTTRVHVASQIDSTQCSTGLQRVDSPRVGDARGLRAPGCALGLIQRCRRAPRGFHPCSARPRSASGAVRRARAPTPAAHARTKCDVLGACTRGWAS
jgi:hypothetical protein